MTATTDLNLDTLIPQPATGVAPIAAVSMYFDSITENCGQYWHTGTKQPYLSFAEKVRFRVEYDITIAPQDPSMPLLGSAFFIAFVTQIRGAYFPAVQTPLNWNEINSVYPSTAGTPYNVNGFFDMETEIEGFGNIAMDNTLQTFIVSLPGYIKMLAGSYIRITQVEILEDGNVQYSSVDDRYNYLTLSSILPDWTAAEFIKQYCLMFNALPVVSGNTLTIIPFDKILSNMNAAKDWSNKLDLSEDYELKYAYDRYGVRNRLLYKDEDNVIKPSGTDGVLIMNNENLEPEVDLIELKYGATEMVSRCLDLVIPQIKVWEVGADKTVNQTEQRILVLERFNTADMVDTTTFTYEDAINSISPISTDIPIPYFIIEGRDFNLGFENNLLDNHFNLIQQIIANPKILTLPIRLNAVDINQLDFLKPIFLQQYESYFYISKIKAFPFTESRSTDVELVKLNL